MVTANWSSIICKYKGRIGFRLYFISVFTVQTGEGGSARPLITVGGDEVPAPRLLYLEEPRGAAWDEDSNSGGLGPELLHL